MEKRKRSYDSSETDSDTSSERGSALGMYSSDSDTSYTGFIVQLHCAYSSDVDIQDDDFQPPYFKKPLLDRLKPHDDILHIITRFSTEYSSSSPPLTLSQLSNRPEFQNCFEVSKLSRETVIAKIEAINASIFYAFAVDKPFVFRMPSREPDNQLFMRELNRFVLKNKMIERTVTKKSTRGRERMMMRVIQYILANLRQKLEFTKSNLFYSSPELFENQSQSDDILDDVSCLIGCTRSSLNVIEVKKGLLVGRLVFSDGGSMVDCTKVDKEGKVIPSIDHVTNMQSDALFILLVEKHSVYMCLVNDRFYERFPCIIITGKGQPAIATMMFLRKMKLELKLPVLGLFDCNPHGLSILSVYCFGSRNMAHDSGNLATPDIKWLGIRPSELNRFEIPEKCRLEMTENDIDVGNALLEEEFVKTNPNWVNELKMMVESKRKVEIHALSFFGVKYLSDVYLPLKLQEMDWI